MKRLQLLTAELVTVSSPAHYSKYIYNATSACSSYISQKNGKGPAVRLSDT